MDGKWMKKCVVVCPENCKSKNVLFSKDITKRIKNRMLEKINNVNVRFLVLSVYKVQNRLLLKTREHKDFIANYR
jgi:ribonuclease HII